jgi:hypothetical protein
MLGIDRNQESSSLLEYFCECITKVTIHIKAHHDLNETNAINLFITLRLNGTLYSPFKNRTLQKNTSQHHP